MVFKIIRILVEKKMHSAITREILCHISRINLVGFLFDILFMGKMKQYTTSSE